MHIDAHGRMCCRSGEIVFTLRAEKIPERVLAK